MWDVYELKLRLSILSENVASCPVRVELVQELPKPVCKAIAKAVEKQWKAAMKQGAGSGWLLEPTRRMVGGSRMMPFVTWTFM